MAVPTHFYKIIVGETSDGKLEMEAFVMPNKPIDDNTPLTNFQVLLCTPRNYGKDIKLCRTRAYFVYIKIIDIQGVPF